MAKANLITVLSLDSSKFKKGIKEAGNITSNLGKKMSNLGKAVVATKRATSLAAKVMLGFAATMSVGITKALALGGRLSDVSDQTGLTVRTIVLWEEAMRQGGVQGELFGSILNKAQKSIHDLGRGMSTQSDAFRRLNLSFRELSNMAPEEQLVAIIKGLEGMDDITSKIGVARDIFGRQGSRLFSTIFDKSAFSKAEQVLGDQIGLLNKNASAFDRISDIIGGIGKKVQGFFVGMADTLLPKLSAAAEAWAKLDFAQAGRQFGHFVSGAIDNFKQIPAVLWSGFKLVLVKLAKGIVDLFENIGSTLGPQIMKLGKMIIQFFVDTFQKMLRATLSGSLLKKGGGLFEGMKKKGDQIAGYLGMVGSAEDRSKALGLDSAVEGMESEFNSMLKRVFGSAGPMPRAFKYTAVQIMEILEREFGSGGMLKIVSGMKNSEIQQAFGNNLGDSIRELKGRAGRRGQVGTESALDALISRRRESIARDGGYGSSGYNPTTDRVNAAGQFGGRNFGFETSGQLGNLGKALNVFGTAPSAAQRDSNAQRKAKSETEKQTAELRKMGDNFEKEIQATERIIRKLEETNLLLGNNTGAFV